MASPAGGNRHCASCIGTLSFAICRRGVSGRSHMNHAGFSVCRLQISTPLSDAAVHCIGSVRRATEYSGVRVPGNF